MIKISGSTVKTDDIYSQWTPGTPGSTEKMIIEKMAASPSVYAYDSFHQLKFEIELRRKIVSSAKALNRSKATFATFDKAKCNPEYWELTEIGGFKLKPGVQPSAAINDIFINGDKYAFECAAAMTIVYYKAVLEMLGEPTFNKLFAGLYIFSWNYDTDLGLYTVEAADYFPGDVRYFKNPDVDPKHLEWQGENVVVMEDGRYYGHGIGITSAERIISALNKLRKPGATRSAYLMDQATRPDFKKLAGYTAVPAAALTDNKPSQSDQEAKLKGKQVKESIPLNDFLSMQNPSQGSTQRPPQNSSQFSSQFSSQSSSQSSPQSSSQSSSEPSSGKKLITVRIGTKTFKV